MTNEEKYIESFTTQAYQQGLSDTLIKNILLYRRKIVACNCVVIYDQQHFAELVGYDYGYILALSSNL